MDLEFINILMGGNMKGNGIEIFSNGDIFKGQFKNDKANGYGAFYFKNGDKYKGEFRDGKSDGYGIFYFNNGDKFEGKFKEAKNNGYGIFYSSLGFKYENYFNNGFYEKFLFNIYKIILFFHYLYSIIIKRKISSLLYIIILIMSYML